MPDGSSSCGRRSALHLKWLIPDLRKCPFSFIARAKLAILQESTQHSKKRKVAAPYACRIAWVRQSWSMMLLEFWTLLIHYGALNCPYVPKKSPAGSDNENSRFPFSNREKWNRQEIADCLCFILIRYRARLICVRWRKSLSWFASFRWPTASSE
jgi:hypothetical protein